MILQELYSYHMRLRNDPNSGVALPGFAPQQISFAVVLDGAGKLVQIQDIRDRSGKKPRPVAMMVPEAAIRSVNVVPNFLWDNTGYVFGADNKGKGERTRQTFEAFVSRQHEIGDSVDDEGMRAVLAFLDTWDPADAATLAVWEEVAGANLVFRLERERRFVHERPLVVDAWATAQGIDPMDDSGSVIRGMCLVTGKQATIARLHNKIKGVKDAQTTGAAVVSFNLDAFCSYGKEQNYNAPISHEAAFAYTTALNYLLRYGSGQKIQIGDATNVFWAEQASPVESFLGFILDPRDTNLPDAAARREIADFLEAVRSGKKPARIDESIRFHILGLSANASRIAVRFWYAGTVGNLDRSLGQHFKDLDIIREFDNQIEFPGIWHLLIETALLRKSDNINPTLAGSLMRSILTGAAYPSFLLTAIMERIRADHEIGYYRAALIKGVLCRNARIQSQPTEVTRVLNESSTNVAYRLGRLFAVLEKTQQEAIPTAKATIKDRFYGSASATPSVVFPQLLRLSQNHIAKLDEGPKIHNERMIQEIIGGIDGFPAHLMLEDQGMFALGYYHQRKALFTKRETA